MDKEQLAIVQQALLKAQSEVHAAGLKISIKKVEFIQNSQNSEDSSTEELLVVGATTLDICCKFWNTNVQPPVCAQFEIC